jgi:hypothetical protein
MEKIMRRTISILATALLATSLLTVQADARGGGGFGGGGHAGGMGGGFGGGAHVGGFGGGAHIGGGLGAVGGLGGAHIGGMGHIGGLGGTHIGGIGAGDRIGAGIHPGVMGSNIDRFDGPRGIDRGRGRFAMHRFNRIYPYYYGNDCYDWYLLHPDTAVPPYCS